jgi:hypothetical protein
MGFIDTLLGVGGKILNSGAVKKGIDLAHKGYGMYRGAKDTYKKYVPKQARTFIKSNIKGAVGGLAAAYKRRNEPPPQEIDDDDEDDYTPPRRYSPPPRRYSPPPRRSAPIRYRDYDDDDDDDYEPPSRYRRRY